MTATRSGPVELGTVIDLGRDGEGVIRNGKTVFVPGALPGEVVKFVRRRSRRQHDEGELIAVESPSVHRADPICAHFGRCGGCTLQHLSSDGQVELKQRELAQCLARIGQVAPQRFLAPLRAPTRHYRRRARLGVRYVAKKNRVVVGFRERFKPYVADLDQCPVLVEPVGSLLRPLSHVLNELSIRERLPQVEIAVGDSGEVAMVLRTLDAPSDADLERLQAFAEAHSLLLFLQPAGPSSVVPLSHERRSQSYCLPNHDLRLEFAPTDFVQVNALGNRLLVDAAIELLDCNAGDSVLDLYCGIGNFTLPIARRARQVLGIEGAPELVARASANAQLNGIGNAQFVCRDLTDGPALAHLLRDRSIDLILLDPPRAGAQAILPVLADLRCRRIVYISCHPASLARDLGQLVHEFGYRLEAAGSADMFAHTGHQEALALLTL
ncbi:MAG: 23S rRNA (uracil(1939)-C(5))-methyltransferase RlmD [Steroidobacteraceae bacterium]